MPCSNQTTGLQPINDALLAFKIQNDGNIAPISKQRNLYLRVEGLIMYGSTQADYYSQESSM